MSTKTTILVAYAATAVALIALIAGGTAAWWAWAAWAAVTVGVAALHIAARRGGMM